MAARLFRGLGWLVLAGVGLSVLAGAALLLAAVFVGVLLSLPR